jgi:hypothetical protein
VVRRGQFGLDWAVCKRVAGCWLGGGHFWLFYLPKRPLCF